MKIIAIIQARNGSTRLPGKVLKKINQESMLYYVVQQTLASKLIDDLIIATTNLDEDIIIKNYCEEKKLKCFRGNPKDLLDRYFKCAKKFNADIIVRITSDCPLIDPVLIDKAISKFLEGKYDYVSNNISKIQNNWRNSTCNFPQGMTVEVSNFKNLEIAWKNAKKPSEREHVFPYIQFNKNFLKFSFKSSENLDFIRCTVDRKEDLVFVKKIMQGHSKNKIFHIKDIKDFVEKNPESTHVNKDIKFDEGYIKSLNEDRKKEDDKKNKKILIYVNGDKKIGMGHVYRSKNLADEFISRKFSIVFLTKTPKIKNILGKNYKCYDLKNFINIKKKLAQINPEIIIIDQLEEKKLIPFFKVNSKLLVGLDYIGKNKSQITKGINSLYQKSGKQGKNSISNFQLTIINKKFQNYKPIKIKNKPTSILVLQGGSDTHCLIPKIIKTINQIPKNFKITTILGPSFSCKKMIDEIKNDTSKKLRILKNVENMAKEMINHDIAITGGGLSLLELSSLGIPSIVICSEKFEEETAKMMEKAGFGKNLGYFQNLPSKKIIKTLDELIENYMIRKNMNQIGQKMIDSRGTKRVADQIIQWSDEI
jgi:spore coat polysaccharide biosynthesis protein SpsF